MQDLFNSKEHLKGIILDMDGVITDTRKLHFDAWKRVFDSLLARHGQTAEFSKTDYETYLDGKLRDDGIQSFLHSRKIFISKSESQSLGDKKNEIYLDLVRTADEVLFEEAEECLKKWKALHIPLGLITSSRNASILLEKANLKGMFDVIIDSVEAESMKLKGKPEPDYFLAAARRMGLDPDECTVVEDSISGIKAAKAGEFHDIVGISRYGQTPPHQLIKSGADTVVQTLENVLDVPHALVHWEEIKLKLRNFEPILFLDLDGTLTETVELPDCADISKDMLTLLQRLSRGIKLIILSGRDLSDLKSKVGIQNIFYVGCHGLDISGPGCFRFFVDEVQELAPELELLTMEVTMRLSMIKGVLIDRKRYCTNIYLLHTSESDEASVSAAVSDIVSRFNRFKIKRRKKVLEIIPNLSWNKLMSFKKILGILNGQSKNCIPLYIGDDETDEEVFRSFGHDEIGIIVDETKRHPTWARYYLSSSAEVYQFLASIDHDFNGSERKWTRGN